MDERERIAGFLRHRRVPLPEGAVGPAEDDDAAVLPMGTGDLVVTTDLVAEGVHFFADAPPEWVGRFAVHVNLSDLAAMGARPAGFLVAYGTPPGDDPAWMDGVAEGVAGALMATGCPLLGGDTKEAACRTATGTALGLVPTGTAVLRSGARPGDRLVLTGAVGGPAAALSLHASGDLPTKDAMRVVLGREARLDAGAILREAGATALVDLSDGLARSATLVARASATRLDVDAATLPLDPLVLRATDDDTWAATDGGRRLVVGTGGEYELLAAVPADRIERALEVLAAAGTPAATIGTVTDGEGAWLVDGDDRHPLGPLGWTHFS